MFKDKKIGIIGYSSKRYNNFYRSIIKKLKFRCLIWNRTDVNYDTQDNEKITKDIKDLEKDNLDLILCFINDKNNFDFLNRFSFKCLVLIETPVTDTRWLTFKKFNVGVLEQWISYPLELFKKQIYDRQILEKPYQLFNDGRTFDYHSIAQLRNISDNSLPVSCLGIIQNVKQGKFIDNNNNIVDNVDDWTYGMSQLANGAVIIYNFTYNCKKSLLKPYQLIRHVSSNGSITTGRSSTMGNDYEVCRITYIKNEKVFETTIQRIQNKDVTEEIICKDLDIIWKNKFKHLKFNDAQTAAAYLIDQSLNNLYYSTNNAYIDILITSAMKQSAYNQQVIKFR